LDPKRKQALTRLLDGASANQVANELGVNRSTVGRWMKDDPEFQAALSPVEGMSERARGGLAALVPKALRLLDQSLSGDSDIPPARATLALKMVQAAAQVGSAQEKVEGTLASRLAELDARDDRLTD